MQSRHVAAFNHDPWADGYDAEVQNEQMPVRAVFGDLMVENAAEQQRLVERYRGLGDDDTLEGLTEEFYWRIDLSLPQIAAAGLELVEVRRFSELS